MHIYIDKYISIHLFSTKTISHYREMCSPTTSAEQTCSVCNDNNESKPLVSCTFCQLKVHLHCIGSNLEEYSINSDQFIINIFCATCNKIKIELFDKYKKESESKENVQQMNDPPPNQNDTDEGNDDVTAITDLSMTSSSSSSSQRRGAKKVCGRFNIGKKCYRYCKYWHPKNVCQEITKNGKCDKQDCMNWHPEATAICRNFENGFCDRYNICAGFHRRNLPQKVSTNQYQPNRNHERPQPKRIEQHTTRNNFLEFNERMKNIENIMQGPLLEMFKMFMSQGPRNQTPPNFINYPPPTFLHAPNPPMNWQMNR